MNRSFWSRRRQAHSDFDPLTCDGAEPLLSLYVDGMAGPEEARRVETHLTTCADCREALAWMKATHRALASRPVMAPPANLSARIAEAIAASSSAPVRLSPIRAFQLRPVYATAASVIVVGIVLGVSLLHQPVPHSTVVPPTVVAVKPNVTVKPLLQHNHTVVATTDTKTHAAVHPITHHDESVATIVVPLTKTHSVQPQSRLVRDNQFASAVKVPTPHTLVKEPIRTKSNETRLATNTVLPTEHQQPSVVPPMPAPKIPSPTQEANNAAPTVPVKIGPSTVTTQTETSHIQLASGMLGDVLMHMRNAGYAPVIKSASRTMSNMHGINISDATVQPAIWTPR